MAPKRLSCPYTAVMIISQSEVKGLDQKKIDRINELTRISRSRELSADEQKERAILREEYIAASRRSLASTLDNTYIVDEDGNKTKLKMKE